MVSFIDRSKVRPIRVRGRDVWGWTYERAGFVPAGDTKGGLLCMQLLPDAMPEPLACRDKPAASSPQPSLFAA